MKLEYSVVLILCFGLVSVLLWYFLNIIPIEFAIEYSVLFFLILTIGFITYSIHGKGILTSPKTNFSESIIIGYRNGLTYQRRKFRLDKTFPTKSQQKRSKEQKPSIDQRIRSNAYTRKKYRN